MDNCKIYKALQNWLDTLAIPPQRIWVALSGGPDSMVLLHALHAITNIPLAACHVDHGLSPNSRDWTRHCESICDSLQIPIEIHQLSAKPARGESIEAWARKARYQWFESLLDSGEILCTAHTQSDQAETILLHLMRGSGLSGLSGISPAKPFGKGQLMRPLLSINKEQVDEYVNHCGLQPIEDESNQNLKFDRNYIRHQIMPLLKARFPSAESTMAQSVMHCQASRTILTDLALRDLSEVRQSAKCLSLTSLKQMSTERQKNVLKIWLTHHQLPLPSEAKLNTLLAQLDAKPDACPEITWEGMRLCRYRAFLYLIKIEKTLNNIASQPWDLTLPIQFQDRIWSAKRVLGEGVAIEKMATSMLEIRTRKGGEWCHPFKRAHRPLKKCLQDYQVPPWERDKLPLFYVGDSLVAVGDLFVCHEWAAAPDALGWVFQPE